MPTSIFALLFVLFLFFFAIGVSVWTKNMNKVIRYDQESIKRLKEYSPIYKNYWISIVPYFGKWDNEVQAWEVLCIQNLLTEEHYPNRRRFETYEEALSAGVYTIEEQIKKESNVSDD